VAPFTKNPLKALDAIYRFVGGMSGLRNFALEAPIQPVYDVGRLAELAGYGGRQGYWGMQADQVHVAAGEIVDALDPYSIGADGNRNGWDLILSDDLRVWVLGCFAVRFGGTAGVFEAAAVQVVMPGEMVGPTDTGTGVDQPILIWRGDVLNAFVDSVDDATAPTNKFVLPIMVPPGGAVNLSSQQTGAGTISIRVGCLLWVGAQGTTPPGLR